MLSEVPVPGPPGDTGEAAGPPEEAIDFATAEWPSTGDEPIVDTAYLDNQTKEVPLPETGFSYGVYARSHGAMGFFTRAKEGFVVRALEIDKSDPKAPVAKWISASEGGRVIVDADQTTVPKRELGSPKSEVKFHRIIKVTKADEEAAADINETNSEDKPNKYEAYYQIDATFMGGVTDEWDVGVTATRVHPQPRDLGEAA